MSKGLFLIALGCTAAFSTSAVAQSQTGPRIEAIVGQDNFEQIQEGGEGDTNPDGVFYGIGLGYDFAIASLALGIDAELTESSSAVEIDYEPDTTFSAKFGKDYYVGARLSFAVSSNANIYLKGGFSHLETDYSLDTPVPPLPGEFPNTTGRSGLRFGVGGQYSIGGKSYIGAEYRMSDYDDAGKRQQIGLILGTRF